MTYPDLVHQHARAYIARRIPVFPVRVSADGIKYPAIKGGHGHLDATCDPEVIDAWFGPNGSYRGCGIGGYLAKADPPMAAVDIDVKNGGAGPEQYQALQALHGKVADTVRVLTPTQGWHDWVAMNGALIGSTNGGLPGSPDIDIKGVGGWVVLPPTELPDGRCYAFEDGHKPSEMTVAVDPGWIAKLCPGRTESEARGRWRDVERTALHPLDLRALEALEALGGHSPFIGGDGCVHVTRPGKTAGTSASIGYIGPGIVGLRTPHWKGLVGRGDLTVYTLDELEALEALAVTSKVPTGRLVLSPAADIPVRRVHWCWDERLPQGTLSLLAGPEGLGKSTVAYTVAALLTRGALPGEHFGAPRAVLVSATEDSWSHTIVPRLMAADADLALVYRIEARAADDIMVGLSLPDDLAGLEGAARQTGAALLLLDPLMSRLHESLDTHKDGEVRRALEPLVSVADNCGMTIWGIIHHNKSGSADPLTLVMASKAFTAVARSVHTVIRDPDDEGGQRRFFGTVKSNLGRLDLPTLSFTIISWHYDTPDGPGSTGRVDWGPEIAEGVGDIMARAAAEEGRGAERRDAKRWLKAYMDEHGPRVLAREAREAYEAEGFSEPTMRRARQELGVTSTNKGSFGGRWTWVAPDPSVKSSASWGGDYLTTMTTMGTTRDNIVTHHHNSHKKSPQGNDDYSVTPTACRFEPGSIWCANDPCPHPHHKARPS